MTGSLLLVTLGLSLAHAGDTPDLAALTEAWATVAPTLQVHARIPVALDSDDLEAVASGDVARHRWRVEDVDRVVGATWSALPRDALWLAILDDTCDKLIDGLTELHLPPEQAHQKILFQHVQLPWPFDDRQWIIDIRNNSGMYGLTEGSIWERTWTLADQQELRRSQISDPAFPDEDAVWTPLNEGGWLLMDAAGGTLLVYHGRADIGGRFPDALATRYALSTLKGMMRHVVDRAEEIPEHYDAAHDPISRPDGSAVPPWTYSKVSPR